MFCRRPHIPARFTIKAKECTAMLDEILDYNRRFVEEHHYKTYETSK